MISAPSLLAFNFPSPSLSCCGWMGSTVCVLSSLSGSGAPPSVTKEGSSELAHTLSSRPGGGQHGGLVPSSQPAGISQSRPSPWVLRTAPRSRVPNLPPRWRI